MRKNIINQTGAGGLGSITTIDTPPTSGDREIVVWDGVDANTLTGGGIVISTNGVLEHPLGISFTPTAFNPGLGNTAWVNNSGELYLGGNKVGGGDVVGPASSTADALAAYDGTTGKLIKSSNITTDGDALTFPDGEALRSAEYGELLFVDDFKGSIRLGTGGDPASTGTGSFNIGIGKDALASNLSTHNVAVGYGAMTAVSGGNANVAVGNSALAGCFGSGNVAVGYAAGEALTGTESNNVLIGHQGVLGDNNTIRIGNTADKCFIAGVYGVGISDNDRRMVVVDPAGQVGSQLVPIANVIGGATSQPNQLAVYTGTDGKYIKKANVRTSTSGNAIEFPVDGRVLTNDVYGELLTTDSLRNAVYVGRKGTAPTPTATGSTSIGSGTLAVATGNFNTAVGMMAGTALTTGNNNVAVGSYALNKALTGVNNIAVGHSAGTNFTGGEGNNIMIGAYGTAGDNNRIRIGQSGIHTSAFVTGVRGTTVTSPQMVTIDGSGQLGSAAIPSGTGGDVVGPATATSGNLATYNGTTGKVIADSGIAASSLAIAENLGRESWVGDAGGGNSYTSWRRVTRIGKQIIVTLEDLPAVTYAGSQFSFAEIPVGARPPGEMRWPAVVWSAGAFAQGYVSINTLGVVRMAKFGGNFSGASGGGGWMTFTYLID